MSEIVKSEYNALDEQGNYKTHYFKTSADQVVGLGRLKSFSYSVSDVAYSDTNNKVALKCVTAGTTSADELDISDKNIGDTVTDGSVVWQVCNRTSDVTSVNGKTGDVIIDFPVGHMYWSVEPTVPAGRLPASGALYNRSLYQGLYNWADERGLVKSESEWQAIASANDGYCEYYSSGDGSTTFRVPKLPTTIVSDVPSEVPVVGNGMTLGVTDGCGNYGLRASGGGNGEYLTAGSSLYGQNVGSESDDSGVQDLSLGVTTDPTKSGIVAQTSSTKITGQWLIVAFGVAHNIGEADIAEVMQAVEQVQTGLGTLEQGVGTAVDYIVESYRNGTEWYEVYRSGKVRQGGSFAPSSGSQTKTYLLPFESTKYTLTTTIITTHANFEYPYYMFPHKKTVTGFIIFTPDSKEVEWVAEGQGA